MKKLLSVVLIVLAFVAGYLLPRSNNLVKGQQYKAGPYTVVYRTYQGRGGKICHKIDINGKHNLIGGIYKKGATIEEKINSKK